MPEPLTVTVKADLGKLLQVLPLLADALRSRAGRVIDDDLLAEIGEEIGPKVADLIEFKTED